MADARPTIKMRDLVAVLKSLPPTQSVLLIGPHGIGKSQIARQLSEHFEIPFIDRRLAQMTEGDMVGLPIVTDDVTRFLPVDWFKKGCGEPVMMCLDELNRATLEIMNSAFQIVLDREMNGNKLHPETRVIACVNAGAHYTVNDMDAALINRFAIFNLEPDEQDWFEWARGAGNIDPIIIDYIKHNPKELREKDLGAMEAMTAYPTPRGWAAVDRCLKYANMAPSDIAGGETPGTFFQMAASLIGHPTAVGFTKFVKNYSRVITAADVLDNWTDKQELISKASHDEIVGVLDKIGEHCKKNTWTSAQMDNLVAFGDACFTGEDYLTLFRLITSSKNTPNIRLFHMSPATEKIMNAVNKAESLKNS